MFDLLFLNGEPLVKKPFIERRTLLRKYFKEVEGEWAFANHLDTTAMEEVQEYLEESVKGNQRQNLEQFLYTINIQYQKH